MLNASKLYHKANHGQVFATTTLLDSAKDEVLRTFGNSSRLIDIGTGDGKTLVEVFLKAIDKDPLNVVGSDRRKESVDFARETYGNDSIKFEVLDIEHATDADIKNITKDGLFDFGTSFICLQYAIDQEKAFLNINKLLKTGGSFYFIYSGYSSIDDCHLKIALKYPQMKKEIVDQLFLFAKDKRNKENLTVILNKTGFKIEFLKFETLQYDFEKREKLRDMAASSLPILYTVAKDLSEKMLEDYLTIHWELTRSSGKQPYCIDTTFVHGLITKKE